MPHNSPVSAPAEETLAVPPSSGKQTEALHQSLTRLKGSAKKESRSKLKALRAIIPKPEVWARIKPPPNFEDNILKVGESGKKISVLLNDPYKIKETDVYPTDGILYHTSQVETFQLIADDLVEKALNGTSVLFVTLGSAQSGKQFTLFGTPGKYDHRGLIPRTVDKICNRMEVVSDDTLYQLFISGIQISQNHIRDLITMTPYNIDRIGKNGPCQTLLHEVYNRDEAGAIIHRIFSGIKDEKYDNSPRNFHIFIYLDICITKLNEQGPIQRSRITFAKVASIPKREHVNKSLVVARGGCVDFQGCSCDPAPVQYSIRALSKFQSKDLTFPYEGVKCCRHKLNSQVEESSEAIDIRRDLFFLEQLFVRANTIRKLSALKRKRPELVTTYMQKLHVTPSQFVRQCKLTHCLQDMCKVNTEVRVLIHVRPETAYIDSTIDSLKFAERVKGIPSDSEFTKHRRKRNNKMANGKLLSTASLMLADQKPEAEQSLMSTILAEAEKTGDDVTVALNPYQVRMLQQQLNQYFKEKLELKEVKAKPVPKKKMEIMLPIVAPPPQHTSKGLKHLNDRRASTSNSDVNKHPTPPPSLVSVAEDTRHGKAVETNPHSHPHSHLAQDSIDSSDKKSDGTPDKGIEREKSAAVIFKKDDDKHGSKKGKKQAIMQSKVDKSKKTEKKSSQNSADKKLPQSSRGNRKKSHAALPKVPNTAPQDAKQQRMYQEKEETEVEDDVIEEDAPPTCSEVWNSFLQSRVGARSFLEFKKNHDGFSKLNSEQQTLKEYSNELLQKINPLQTKLEQYKVKRFLKFPKKPELMKSIPISRSETDIRYDLKVLQLFRDPLLVRLGNMGRTYGKHEDSFENSRKSFENAFLLFSLKHFGVLFPTEEIPINIPGFKFELPIAIRAESPVVQELSPVEDVDDDRKNSLNDSTRMKKKAKSFPMIFAPRRRKKSLKALVDSSIHSKHYKNVSRVGKFQAALLRKLNHFKPAWVKYY